uniref:Seminal fluid protein n=1 Tax=Nilaparvata lugens TaxID=108931 RepID=A0A1I9WLA6_NILLU|nr:seminal fluid protein [Nilaparvata lugens]
MERNSEQICVTLCVVFLCITSILANQCVEVGRPCTSHDNCCSSCCGGPSTNADNGLCLKSCAPQDNPCKRKHCALGEYCKLEQVDCIRAPCEPFPVCKTRSTANTDPCATVHCRDGYHCEAIQVQCFAAPCNPVGRCVPNANTDPCATVKCSDGYHCEPTQVQCIRAPCPPVGQCVPNGNACDRVRCQSGTKCVIKPGTNSPSCVPTQNGGNPCALALCQENTRCVVQPDTNTPSCVPIKNAGGCQSK